MLHTRLDAADQCVDLTSAQAIVDINPGDDPYPARAEESEQELADGGHTGIPKEQGPYFLLLRSAAPSSGWPGWDRRRRSRRIGGLGRVEAQGDVDPGTPVTWRRSPSTSPSSRPATSDAAASR
ncbi:MAG TPA: hypothetical protein VLW50_13585 [Streptosporangiaceae bacterium]|nr:hypothetical protein [Streptosporangiaceae bacterium]